MRVREAVDTDVACILSMALRFLESTNYGKLLSPAPGMVEQLIDQVMQLGTILVAEVPRARAVGTTGFEVGPVVVGMIAIVALPHPVTGEEYADEVAWWVEPEYRNATVGPRLLKAAEAWACKKGIHMLKMVAPAHSDVGEFYRRQGYLETETAWVKVLKST